MQRTAGCTAMHISFAKGFTLLSTFFLRRCKQLHPRVGFLQNIRNLGFFFLVVCCTLADINLVIGPHGKERTLVLKNAKCALNYECELTVPNNSGLFEI